MKFNMSKWKAVGAIATCVYAAVAAFMETRERQVTAEQIEELQEKVAELEKGKS